MFDVAIVGAGLVGLATARALVPSCSRLVVLEAEPLVGAHQSGRNSGVAHSGLYYTPGSLKARLSVEGRDALSRYCADRGIAFERCGKLVVASRVEELPALDELERRGRANGLRQVRRITPPQIQDIEPHAVGSGALFVGDTGIVDFPGVARALADDVVANGGEVRTGARMTGLSTAHGEHVVETDRGPVHARALVACAGLHADRLAFQCGLDPGVRIVPFRGEYYRVRGDRRGLVRHLIYPVPDPEFPFLGVHLTRTVRGEIEAGPNAVLALARHGYRWSDVAPADIADLVTFPGFLRFARRHWRAGLREARRSLSRRRFAAALARLVPEISSRDLVPGGAGVRAMALTPDGVLVDDFRFVASGRMIHVLNAPSPAATACLAIGERLAAMARDAFGLEERRT